jgi:cytochrome oxidase assembly protein ShyY1
MLKPKWLSLFAVLVVLLVAFTFLGLWQLSVARDQAQRAAIEAAAAQAPVPLEQVLSPHTAFPADASGRPVTVTGRYDPSGQVLVADRRLNGVSGWWVVTPLVVDGSAARIAILRGFVVSATGAGPAPTEVGSVSVTGTLAPGESPGRSAALPPGQLPSLDLARLVNLWPGELFNAFVFATVESPNASMDLQRVPPPPIPSGLTWRNAVYALQWWVFGLFAAWMWWRMVRDDYRREQAATHTAPGRKTDSSDGVRPAGATT